MKLKSGQLNALGQMKNGCILCGGVGSGKSITSLAYYWKKNGGDPDLYLGKDKFDKPKKLKDLYIITTARKRDDSEWDVELSRFYLYRDKKLNPYGNKVVVDSWNNISKYADVTSAFFIFDEQRVVGSGTWAKSFIKIAKRNQWILLSATPGDKFEDYIPVFIANGFYKNRTEFKREHLIYSPWTKFPQVIDYRGVKKLENYRDSILVNIDYSSKAEQHHEYIDVGYDKLEYKALTRTRWNAEENRPIRNVSEYCYLLRKCVNSYERRQKEVLEICENHEKCIIFYNFDYELEILENLGYLKGTKVAQWNGHKHEPIPKTKRWVYLVQYTAGAEGWNCIETDTMIFFSQNYSYKQLIQAAGRIDRMNTRFTDLYYYHLKSSAPIDKAISRALANKKEFNQKSFCKGLNFN